MGSLALGGYKYLVNRASIEPNLHTLYGFPEWSCGVALVLKETFSCICAALQKDLSSDKFTLAIGSVCRLLLKTFLLLQKSYLLETLSFLPFIKALLICYLLFHLWVNYWQLVLVVVCFNPTILGFMTFCQCSYFPLPDTSLCFQFPLSCTFRLSGGGKCGCCSSSCHIHVFLIPPLYHRLMMLFYFPINKLTILSLDNFLRSPNLFIRKKSRHTVNFQMMPQFEAFYLLLLCSYYNSYVIITGMHLVSWNCFCLRSWYVCVRVCVLVSRDQ